MADNSWERSVLEKVVLESLKEQKSKRRWGIFFRILLFLYLFTLLFYAINEIDDRGKAMNSDHTALINIQGIIEANGQVSADSVINSLQEAYDNKHTKGIILRINSPGGSPVQAGIINDEIKRQRKLHPNVPIYSVVEEICASGGYYIAVATEKIFVDKASIIGSIGVISEGFGFSEILNKIGVERRVITAGKNKAILDPFTPENKEQREFLQKMLDEIHLQFIKVVREGRKNKLKEDADTFSGLFWNGETGIKLGLADNFGSLDFVAREIIKQKNIVDFTERPNLADRVVERLGATITNTLISEFKLK